MAYTIEGNDVAGYRVVDDEVGALTGRQRTAEAALALAGIDEKPAKPAARTSAAPKAPRAKRAAAKKPADKPVADAVTTADVTGTPDES